MASRTFADSAGTVWEVFEVRRSSNKPGAVSTGLEQGWLSFSSPNARRRLAPIPPEWATSPDPELERLCSRARVVAPATHVFEPTSRDRRRKENDPAARPDSGERRRAVDYASEESQAASANVARAPTPGGETGVEATVRRFAHDARARGQPAIDAMVQLKALLQAQFGDEHADMRDIKSVRRWFVETYYFEGKR